MAITRKYANWDQNQKRTVETVETFGEGCVLKVYRDSIQVMSDVWEMTTHATYWDETQQRLLTVPWVEEAKVDATPEVLEKVKTYLYNKAFERMTDHAREDAERILKGSVVKVVSGRSGKGTVGTVVVSIQRPYKMGYRSVMSTKVGIATSDEKVKVAASNGRVYENYKDVVWAWSQNCELVNVPEIDFQSVRERAERISEEEFKQVYKVA